MEQSELDTGAGILHLIAEMGG